MKIRIPLTPLNHILTHLYTASQTKLPSSLPAVPCNAVECPQLSAAPPTLLPDYNYSRYSHPAVPISVAVPDGDLPLVALWLGASSTGAAANSPSDTLIKRMTAAVMDALNRYFSGAARQNLFTSPFRIGYALRLADGNNSFISDPVLMKPAAMAPVMAIHEPKISGNTLHTVTEIVNTPALLSLRIADREDIPAGASLVVFATKPVSLLAGDETVTSIRTFELFGDKTPGWNYQRLAEDFIARNAMADTSFRIIADIPFDRIPASGESIQLPFSGDSLYDWTSFPTFTSPEDWSPEPTPEGVMLVTTPLDLFRPEEYKKVRGVTLRGNFNRGVDEGCVEFTLLGSQHRDNWHVLVKARGAHLRFLRAVAYRWYKVEIRAPYPAFFDAITFDIA